MGDGLRAPGGILLISTYELGHQPMGLAMPAAFLRRAGFSPTCVDTSVEFLDQEVVRRARLVALSAPMHTALRLGIRIARRVRRTNPEARIAFFRDYSWLNRDILLGAEADFVIGGECEQRLVEVAAELEAARGNGRSEGGVPATGSKFLGRLDFPVPHRAGLPGLQCYARLRSADGERLSGYVEASRGCRHHCAHCPIPPVYGGRFFAVPRDIILADVQTLVRDGARHLTFGDPDFLNAPRHSMMIAEAIHEEFPGLTFDFTAKIEHLRKHARLLQEFARLGCVFIVTAAESLNDEVLRILGKGHTRADLQVVVSSMRECGIVLRPSLVAFTPWTALGDYLEFFSFAEKEGLVDCIDPIQYTIRLLVHRGSPLACAPEMQPHLCGFDPEGLTYTWRHPDPRMDGLQLEVSRLVEQTLASSASARSLFGQLRECALATCESRPRRVEPGEPDPALHPVYGLTEPWFC